MLKSFCKGAAAIAVALSFSSVAQAEEHVVMIVNGDYFPNVVYAAQGDQLVFVNQSTAAHTVNGDDDVWTSGVIGAEEQFSIELTETTPPGWYAVDGTAGGEIVFQ